MKNENLRVVNPKEGSKNSADYLESIESQSNPVTHYMDKTFVNFYTDENPFLHEGEQAYFLFMSTESIHAPIVGKGVVYFDKLHEMMHKTYYIKLEEILEDLSFMEKFVYGKPISFLYVKENGEIQFLPKIYNIKPHLPLTIYQRYVLKIDGFFVRNSLEEILKVRKEYMDVVVKDMKNNLSEAEYILNI